MTQLFKIKENRNQNPQIIDTIYWAKMSFFCSKPARDHHQVIKPFTPSCWEADTRYFGYTLFFKQSLQRFCNHCLKQTWNPGHEVTVNPSHCIIELEGRNGAGCSGFGVCGPWKMYHGPVVCVSEFLNPWDEIHQCNHRCPNVIFRHLNAPEPSVWRCRHCAGKQGWGYPLCSPRQHQKPTVTQLNPPSQNLACAFTQVLSFIMSSIQLTYLICDRNLSFYHRSPAKSATMKGMFILRSK